MQQIVDLENDPIFQSLNVALLSIALDPMNEQALGAVEYGIQTTPLLSDPDKSVSTSFDALKWAVPSGEPGHTFILVGTDGKISWIKDYGAPDNPNRTMYVPIEELVKEVQSHLD